MSKLVVVLLVCLSTVPAYSQNGLHFLKRFDNKHGTTSGVSYSGSWGYVGPEGREYAILGTATGTAIIEITDTGNVHEIAHIGGPISIWREMRTYKNYLYIVSEGGLGTQIVNLSFLPAGVDHVKNFVYASGSKNTVRSHTIEIFDGYMYLNGCANWSPGGVLIFSLADPENPKYVGEYQPPGTGSQRYVHDCYVRHDTIYAASIYASGGLSIASVVNKTSPSHIAKIGYSGSGTHNAWTTSDGRYAITTDEIGSTPKTLKFWDLSTLPTPPESTSATYQFSPLDIEHNVFVRGTYAYTAWYTAGIVVVDVHTPTSPTTAGWYDTSNDILYPPGNYDGVWAVYPYFWSGKVTAGDMQNGLYIFTFDSLQTRTPTSLIEPADQSNLCNNDSITFRWSRVADSLQDPHTYWLHVYSQAFDSTFKVGNDSSFTLSNPQVLGTGTFSWHVLTVDEANQVSSQDTFAFVRPAPTVSGPNGGESLKIFSQATISWNWQCTDSLEISLSTNNGTTWTPIAIVPNTPNSYLWNVPTKPTIHALIRVRDITDTTRVDMSDSVFTIFNSASITITSPNGGEIWQGDSIHQIIWSSVLVDSLKIEYSADGGLSWSTVLADTLASIGSYNWKVPNTFTAQGLIRVTDLFNTTVLDQSDTPFSVALMAFNVEADWNLASVPVNPVYPSAPANFPFAISPAFAYSGSYVEVSTVTHGIGYWIKYTSGRIVPALGTLMTTDTITLATQWNMIGSISTPIPISSITAVPDSIVLSNFFEYTTGLSYTVADSIKPGRGYWVKASIPGELVLSSSAASPSSRVNIVPTSEMPPAPPHEKGVSNRESRIPSHFSLEQNYPNPFNPTTDFGFQIPARPAGGSDFGFVSLKIYDVLGREVAILVNEEKQPGYYSARWDASDVSSGMYYARMTVADASGKQQYQQTIKVLLVR